jgi:hypothetical protein
MRGFRKEDGFLLKSGGMMKRKMDARLLMSGMTERAMECRKGVLIQYR